MTPRTPEQNEAIREQTRRQIKDAAFSLFARHGFSNTSVSSIAGEAEISKGLIYHYFESKKEILKAIFDDLAALGDRAMDFPESLTPRECMERMLEMLFGFIREEKETMRLLISLALQPDVMEEMRPSIEEYNARQLEALTHLLHDLGREQPETEAFYLSAKLDGIALGYITLDEDYPIEEIKQKLLHEYVSETETH
ncbi:MAG: TetR/AcrR family transcriptional regulator [Balneolaceae bacterium]|nr:TetR/AcrR family transcriptional regulator [Balneolaceae bacterium]